MVAATAMFAAASCAQELENNQVPEVNGETVVYTASVDGADTKAVLDGVVSKWCGEELITLHDGTNPFTFYADAGETPVSMLRFSYTPGEGQPEFTATEVMAVYPSGDYTANISDKTVSNVVVPNSQALADNTYPATAAVAVAYSTNAELNFKNATALLKFKVAGDDVSYGCFAAEGNISGKFDVAYNEGKPVMTPAEADQWVDFYKNDGFLSEDATYYLAIAPASVSSFTMYLNGQEVKKYSSSYNFERNVILDLGTITYDAPANASTVYLKPGVWSAADAWYVAYFFSSTANKAVTMEDTDADGLFEAAVPEGDYSKVIFCRMNSAASELTWEEGNVWNQTSNLNVPFASDNKLCYVVENWDVYAWQTLEDAKYVAPEWTVAGTFNGWNATANPMELVDGYYVAKNVTGLNFTAQEDPENTSSATGFQFINNGAWKGGEGQVTAGTWTWVWNDNGANIYVDGAAAETKYDIYLNPTPDAGGGIKFVVVAAGTPMPEDKPADEEVVVDYWAVIGSMTNNWGSDIEMTLEGDWYVAEDVKILASDQFKFRANGNWDEGTPNRGAAGNADGVMIENEVETAVYQGGKNFCVSEGGFYSLYINKAATKVKVVKTADLPVESIPDQPCDWAIWAQSPDWEQIDMVTTTVPDLFVAKGVVLDSYKSFLVKPAADWSTKYGCGAINYIQSNKYIKASQNGGDITVEAAGTYDIYFDNINKNVYLMTSGTAYTAATQQTTSGIEPEPEPEPETGITIYLKPGVWETGGARYQAWIWGAGDQWVTFTKVSDGLYSTKVPEGTTGMKVLRKGPDHANNAWQSWNDTGDVTLGGKNCIEITDWNQSYKMSSY